MKRTTIILLSMFTQSGVLALRLSFGSTLNWNILTPVFTRYYQTRNIKHGRKCTVKVTFFRFHTNINLKKNGGLRHPPSQSNYSTSNRHLSYICILQRGFTKHNDTNIQKKMTKEYIMKRLEKKGYKVTEDSQTSGVIVIVNSFPFPFRSLADAWNYFKNK